MKLNIKKKPRKFLTGIDNKIVINDLGSIKLKSNEQITFKKNNYSYDLKKKEWGYYVTPSTNKRLINSGYKSYLVKNNNNRFYVLLVEKDKEDLFKKYIKKEKISIVVSLYNIKNILDLKKRIK